MVTYNLTELATGNLDGVITYANDASNGMLMGLILMAIFFVILISLKFNPEGYGFDESLLAASFISFVLSIVFRYAEWINFFVVVAFLGIAGFTAFWMVIRR